MLPLELSPLELRVVDRLGAPVAEVNILIGCNFTVRGAYYFGGIVGLSSATGTLAVNWAALKAQYSRSRALFPMDYAVEFRECDSVVEFLVIDAEEIQAALGQKSLEQAVRPWYESARNREVIRSSKTATCDLVDKRIHQLALEVEVLPSRPLQS
jgi:hypothetical protein